MNPSGVASGASPGDTHPPCRSRLSGPPPTSGELAREWATFSKKLSDISVFRRTWSFEKSSSHVSPHGRGLFPRCLGVVGVVESAPCSKPPRAPLRTPFGPPANPPSELAREGHLFEKLRTWSFEKSSGHVSHPQSPPPNLAGANPLRANWRESRPPF